MGHDRFFSHQQLASLRRDERGHRETHPLSQPEPPITPALPVGRGGKGWLGGGVASARGARHGSDPYSSPVRANLRCLLVRCSRSPLPRQAYVYLKRFSTLALHGIPSHTAFKTKVYARDKGWLVRVR